MRRIAAGRCLGLLWHALVGAALSGTMALAALPQPGTMVETAIQFQGRSIALPPGPWVVAGSGTGRASGAAPAGHGGILGLLLLRPPGVAADGFVAIHTNLLPVREGWGQPSDCLARDALHRSAAEPRDGRMGCGWLRAVATDDPGLAALPALAGAGPGALAGLPPVLLLAGLRVADRGDMLDIRYGFRPPGPPAGLLDWASGAAIPWRAATIDRLGSWIDLARGQAERRLLSEAAPVLPLPPPLDGAPQVAADLPTWRLGLYKMASYRVASTTLNFVLATALSGSAATGVAVAFWQSVTHSGVFYANELAWEWPRPLPVTDLVAGR